MFVRRTWTEEVGPNRFSKLEVGLDQEDVTRLLTEHLPGVDPSSVAVRDLFIALEYEAAILLVLARRARFAMTQEQGDALLQEAQSVQGLLTGHVAKLKEKYAVV